MKGSSPGQLNPNELETAILRRLAADSVASCASPEHLHVLSREYTGAGSYTTFLVPESKSQQFKRQVSLDALIEIPGVKSGLGAALSLRGDAPECLEIFTYGTEAWNGLFEGYSISKAAQ